jgi:hypothetical protein
VNEKPGLADSQDGRPHSNQKGYIRRRRFEVTGAPVAKTAGATRGCLETRPDGDAAR